MCKFSKTLEFSKKKDYENLDAKHWVVTRGANYYIGDIILYNKTGEIVFESDDYVAIPIQEMFDIARFMRIKEEKHIFNKPYLTK